MEAPVMQDARSGIPTVRPSGPAGKAALEANVRETIAKGLPRLATTALAAAYPMGFVPRFEPSRNRRVASQVVASQLLYTRNLQLLALLELEPNAILKLAQRAFSGLGRVEAPRMVVSANAEALNTMVSKLGCLLGRMDDESEVAITPPVVLNCSGANSIPLLGSESLFLSLGSVDVSMTLAVSLQAI
jgi:hypothetical protein